MVRTVIVGIAGGSASGKSTVVSEVVRRLGRGKVVTLRQDAYYHDLSHMPLERRIEVNVDHPDSLETELLVQHVRALRTGRAIEVPTYDYAAQTRGPRGIVAEPAPVLIVEGLFALWDEQLRALLDLRAYVDVPEEERLVRRIERDARERGRDHAAVVRQHERFVQPMHERFVEPSRQWADVVLEGGGRNAPAIADLVARIEILLQARSA
jgi:uridine kinase